MLQILPGTVSASFAQIARSPGTITYQQILEQPDDLELVFSYARQEAELGNLQASAGALERLLLLEPEWDHARFFYAIVLYRLSDLDGALRELEILEGRDLPEAHMAEVQRYKRLADHENASTRISAQTSSGIRCDTNRNLASERDFGFGGAAGTIPLLVPKRDDVAFLRDLSARIEHDLGSPEGHFLFAQARAYFNEQLKVNVQDFIHGDARAGVTFYADKVSVTPYGRLRGLRIDGHHRLTEASGGIKFDIGLSPSLSLFAGVEASRRRYSNRSSLPPAKLRNGTLYFPSGGASLRWNRHNTLTASLGYYIMDAWRNYHSFTELDGRLSNLTLLGKGQYLLSEVHLSRLRADAPHPAYSAVLRRKDFRFKGRLAYGVPVGTIAQWLGTQTPSLIDNINLQVSAAYFHQNSNYPNFDVENFTGDLIFTKRFKF
ncbi:MAG: hypothetical protein ACR2OR_10645 [Hyphomicrobiales bacterium]